MSLFYRELKVTNIPNAIYLEFPNLDIKSRVTIARIVTLHFRSFVVWGLTDLLVEF